MLLRDGGAPSEVEVGHEEEIKQLTAQMTIPESLLELH